MGFDFKDKNYGAKKVYWKLSDYAYDVLRSDMEEYIYKWPGKDVKNMTQFINRIFINFHESAFSSVYISLGNKVDIQNENTIQSYLLRIIKKKYLQKEAKVRGNRMLKDTVKLLRKSMESSVYEEPNAAVYFRAVLEEYALLPKYERERYIYKDAFDMAKECIDHKDPIKYQIEIQIKGKSIIMFPIKMSTDKNQNHYYIAGVSKVEGSDDPFRSSSIQLTNIDEICYSNYSVGNSDKIEELQEALLEKLKNTDIPYVNNEALPDIQVEFTDVGLGLLRRIVHNRPRFRVNEDNDHICTFYDVTKQEMLNYIRQFGKNAVVISPESIRDELYEFYKDAAEKYSRDQCLDKDTEK